MGNRDFLNLNKIRQGDENRFLLGKSQLSLTCEVIHETDRRKSLEGKVRLFLIFILSSLLAISVVIIIGILQYDEYFAFINQREDYINATKSFCKVSELENIDIISTPIAAALVIFYIVLYKRRVFLRFKYKYRNIGLPMITSCWRKTDRFYTCLVYGVIAFNIYNIVRSSLMGNGNAKKLVTVKDPTGILRLLVRILDMFLVGIRYYPVLVAFRNNAFIINLTSCIYMWIDFVENIYQYGKCESIYDEYSKTSKEIESLLPYFITFKVFSAIPLSIFSSFILVSLTYRSSISLMDFFFNYSSHEKRQHLIAKGKDSFFCLVCNVDDEHEMIYCKHDISYVMDLLQKHEHFEEDEVEKHSEEIDLKKFNKNHIYTKLEKKKKPKIVEIFRKIGNFIYKWDENFRFTSKYVNSVFVGIVTLYYFVLFWGYFVITKVNTLTASLPDSTSQIDFKSLDIVGIICSFSEDLCLENMKLMKFIMPFQRAVQLLPEYKTSIKAIVIVPVFGALLITLVQMLLWVRECKTHLKQLYKGECDFVPKAKSISNASIASSSFHFGGYFVGYLLWGYFLIYAFITLIGAAILFIRIFIGDQFFLDVLLKAVPVIITLLIKKIVNIIATKYVFLNRTTTILALDNFRAFNIFLYFNFYFDCFLGVISALIRLVKALVLSILMMPRISYSFMGRQFERTDNAYGTYSGWLHMESMHTNPIILTFCSVLYYQDLGVHIRRHFREKNKLDKTVLDNEFYYVKMKKFRGLILDQEEAEFNSNPANLIIKSKRPKKYNRTIVNKWFVALMLNKNKELIRLRKRNLKPKQKKEEPSILSKIMCCCKKKEGTVAVDDNLKHSKI